MNLASGILTWINNVHGTAPKYWDAIKAGFEQLIEHFKIWFDVYNQDCDEKYPVIYATDIDKSKCFPKSFFQAVYKMKIVTHSLRNLPIPIYFEYSGKILYYLINAEYFFKFGHDYRMEFNPDLKLIKLVSYSRKNKIFVNEKSHAVVLEIKDGSFDSINYVHVRDGVLGHTFRKLPNSKIYVNFSTFERIMKLQKHLSNDASFAKEKFIKLEVDFKNEIVIDPTCEEFYEYKLPRSIDISETMEKYIEKLGKIGVRIFLFGDSRAGKSTFIDFLSTSFFHGDGSTDSRVFHKDDNYYGQNSRTIGFKAFSRRVRFSQIGISIEDVEDFEDFDSSPNNFAISRKFDEKFAVFQQETEYKSSFEGEKVKEKKDKEPVDLNAGVFTEESFGIEGSIDSGIRRNNDETKGKVDVVMTDGDTPGGIPGSSAASSFFGHEMMLSIIDFGGESVYHNLYLGMF